MKTTSLSFIGGGNMARSLVGGLLADHWPANHIQATDPSAEALARLASLGVRTGSDNAAAVGTADVVVLAVKPQVMEGVARDLAPAVQARRPLVISIAAGIRTNDLERWLGGNVAIVRCMPNTPALVQSGATALFASPRVTDTQRDVAETILRAVGLTLWLTDEAHMDAVTALSGSGPAYFFLVIEALQAAGERLGLPADSARLLALQTAFGAAKMALESDEDAAALRRRVTSPGGTTERALQTLEAGGIRDLINQALAAARDRSRELADELGG